MTQVSVGDELRVKAIPLSINGHVRGVIVYGWVFGTFATPLGCQRIARELGVDGTRLWTQARLESPVTDARLAIFTELLETTVESTARHAEAVQRLQELDRLREVFLAGVSHELRTPLAVLGSRIELLLRGALDNPQTIRDSLLTMRRHVKTEARLVEDLIEVARTRTGQLLINKEPASLRTILLGAVASVLPNAEAKGVSLLTPELEASGELPIFGDAHRLEQVFWNLLSNALKFTPSSGRIALRIREDTATYTISVEDSGSGISPSLLAHIFAPFTKQHDANAQGLGLGLSIARHIVEQHDGKIWADSAGPGTGATFNVLLPSQQQSNQAP
jgi:signal transduction histidine kinase